MSSRSWLMWVTDRRSFDGSLPDRAAALAAAGLDLIQLRENDLPDRALLELASAMKRAVEGSRTRLLINDRVDLALAAGADGVHLKSDGLDAGEARRLAAEQLGADAASFLLGRACHRGEELSALARDGLVDYATLSPLHATGDKEALGLDGFARELARAREGAGEGALPRWLALGGVGEDDAVSLAALARADEAWGVAAVRAFQAPGSDAEAARLARRLGAAVSSRA